ncbi:MAG: Putative oxidoreductase, partial [uncultured Ramlibacter sp.]
CVGLAGGRLAGGAGRPPRRRAEGCVGRGGYGRPRAGRPDRRHRPGVGPGAVRPDRQGLGTRRPAVQQRRHRRARRAARRVAAGDLEAGGRHQPERHVLRHPAGLPRDEGAVTARRPDHQQRFDFGPRAAAQLDRLHRHQACGHGADQDGLARWPQARHRGGPDRHRECADRPGRAHGQGCAPSEWRSRRRAIDGRRHRRPVGALHGQPAARGQRAVPHGDGHQDALRRAWL